MQYRKEACEFSYDLYYRGKAEFDTDKKFFYFYVLLNYFYSSYHELNKNRTKLKEEERLKKFIGYAIQLKNTPFANYNPFALLNTKNETTLINKVVSKLGNINKNYDHKSTIDEVGALFHEIYKVRCDIFHGSKSIRDFEMRRLVEECNTVLERFLDFYIETMYMMNDNEDLIR